MFTKIKEITREIGIVSIGLTLAFIIFIGLSIAKGWTEPTVAPPGGNVGAPITTGAPGQSKVGGLILNTGGATNGLIVQSGNVSFAPLGPNGASNLFVGGTITASGDICTNPGAFGAAGGQVECLSSAGRLHIGPAGCNFEVTTSTTCRTLGCEACSGGGCQTQYLGCNGVCGEGTRDTRCPTQPL